MNFLQFQSFLTHKFLKKMPRALQGLLTTVTVHLSKCLLYHYMYSHASFDVDQANAITLSASIRA